MKLSPEQHLHRLNLINTRVEVFRALPASAQLSTSREGQWNLVQIIQHLNLAYQAYEHRIDTLLERLPDHSQPPVIVARGIPRFFIRMITPNNGIRKWKIQTLPRFRPPTPGPAFSSYAEVYDTFFAYQAHLKGTILASRHKDCRKGRLTSASGPIVRFRLPECFEFIISHAERHLVQADELLSELDLGTQKAV